MAVHVAVAAAVIASLAPRRVPPRRHLLVALQPPEQLAPRSVVLDRATGATIPIPAPIGAAPSRPSAVSVATGAPASFPTRALEATPDPSPAWGPAAAPRGLTGPTLGTGVLWDPRTLAPLLVSRTHAELTDSAVKAIINHYLDSVAALPGGGRILPPSWKGTIGGQEFGLDGRFITVAGFKIPALLLGLIPFPAGGNESEALDKGAWMRAQDYELALPRQAAAADLREQAKEARKRMEAEKELNRMQREPPPD